MFRVADVVFEAHGCGKYFDERAEKYRVFTGEPEFVLEERIEEISSARELTGFPEESLRYILSGLRFSVELIKRSGVVLHASAVALDGRAYLFSAPSGTGKSTHTGNWLELFEKAYILNDDKPAIRVFGEEAYAYGTPWSGKNDLSVNERVKLGGIAFLERAQENSIERVSPPEAAKLILGATARRLSKERVNELLCTVQVLACKTPVYKLRCTADIEAARLASAAMIEN